MTSHQNLRALNNKIENKRKRARKPVAPGKEQKLQELLNLKAVTGIHLPLSNLTEISSVALNGRCKELTPIKNLPGASEKRAEINIGSNQFHNHFIAPSGSQHENHQSLVIPELN
jgi:hypothetical protein